MSSILNTVQIDLSVQAPLRPAIPHGLRRILLHNLRRASRSVLRMPPGADRPANWKIGRDCQLHLQLVTDTSMARIHAETMGERRTTDVLSFPGPGWLFSWPSEEDMDPADAAYQPAAQLGEIVLCWPEVERQARARMAGPGQPPVLETALILAVHGLAHLHGHDHDHPKAARLMFRAECHALRQLGIPPGDRPYARRPRIGASVAHSSQL